MANGDMRDPVQCEQTRRSETGLSDERGWIGPAACQDRPVGDDQRRRDVHHGARGQTHRAPTGAPHGPKRVAHSLLVTPFGRHHDDRVARFTGEGRRIETPIGEELSANSRRRSRRIRKLAIRTRRLTARRLSEQAGGRCQGEQPNGSVHALGRAPDQPANPVEG